MNVHIYSRQAESGSLIDKITGKVLGFQAAHTADTRRYTTTSPLVLSGAAPLREPMGQVESELLGFRGTTTTGSELSNAGWFQRAFPSCCAKKYKQSIYNSLKRWKRAWAGSTRSWIHIKLENNTRKSGVKPAELQRPPLLCISS
ncbi:uncharacterized protein LOC119559411 isoform X2 [Drosophila subpulchrella]|uniref:uncharacterized protein LOC119559411 isoform X2 n=1 Tax=Drosophila subpulchrella TaxID=1486046 RepID=UPI0018A1A01A|nr:uncharacterized protein LOC119559411 isoform X2 [Drosophila subpulchrella]